MVVKAHEALLDVVFLPVRTIVEGNFFGVTDEFSVEVTVLTCEFLFNSSQASKRRRNVSDDNTREEIPENGHYGSLPADEFRKLFTEQVNVENRLCEIQVKVCQTCCPFLGVFRKTLVRVCNSRV